MPSGLFVELLEGRSVFGLPHHKSICAPTMYNGGRRRRARELGIPREKLGRWVFEGEPKSEPREIPGRAEPLLSVLEQDVLARKNRPRRKPFRFDGIYEGVAPNRRLNLLTASRITGVRKDSLRYRVRNGT